MLLSILHLNEHFATRHVPWNGYFQFKSWSFGQNKEHNTEDFGFIFLEIIPHFIPNQANTCQDLNQKFQSALVPPKFTLLHSNGQDIYLRHVKFSLNLILCVRLFNCYHLPSTCLVLQVIRVVWAQFPLSCSHPRALWKILGYCLEEELHYVSLPACLTSQYCCLFFSNICTLIMDGIALPGHPEEDLPANTLQPCIS